MKSNIIFTIYLIIIIKDRCLIFKKYKIKIFVNNTSLLLFNEQSNNILYLINIDIIKVILDSMKYIFLIISH